MSTIQNKKGATGFTCSPWNFIGTSASITVRGENGKKVDRYEVQYIIRPVTVHSCGKKQMYLVAHDDDSGMRKQAFNPEHPIYQTFEDATQAAVNDFPRVVAGTIAELERSIRNTTRDCSHYPWFEEELARLQRQLKDVQDGALTLRTLTVAEWKKDLDKRRGVR